MSTKKRLQKACERVKRELERAYTNDFWDAETETNYFEDVLEGYHLIDLNGDYGGVILVMAFGGPSIYINTLEKCVKGWQGNDYVEVPISDKIAYEVADWWHDWYEAP